MLMILVTVIENCQLNDMHDMKLCELLVALFGSLDITSLTRFSCNEYIEINESLEQ